MQISIISTSPRKDSNSLKVAKAIDRLAEQFGNTSVMDFTGYDIPFLSAGAMNRDNLTDFQSAWINALRSGQLIFFVVPEYNWITSGELINAFHQTAVPDFADTFDNKVFAVCGVSSGRGGRRPAIEIQTLLNKCISFTDKRSIVSPRLFESHETDIAIDTEGNSSGNEHYDKGLQSFVDFSIEIARRWYG